NHSASGPIVALTPPTGSQNAGSSSRVGRTRDPRAAFSKRTGVAEVKLSVKFSLAVGSLLLAALGGTAWLLIEHQQRELRRQVLHRARAALTFGEACREYARETLSPAVQAHTDRMIFEANSATFVARGVFEAVR